MSPRRITVSTIGIIPGMITFLEQSEAHLAVSLHTPFDEERKMLMPVQVAYPIAEVVSEIRKWDFSRQSRQSYPGTHLIKSGHPNQWIRRATLCLAVVGHG